MKLNEEEARALARLAGLDPADRDLARITEAISAIIDHFETIRGIDAAGVPPTGLNLEVETPFRKDVPGDPLPLTSVLRPAPEKEGPLLVVPRLEVGR